MSYGTVVRITKDTDLRLRLIACAVEQGKPNPVDQWVADRLWTIAVTPGWAVAYESAMIAPPSIPIGQNDAVITDQMILSVIQPME